MCQIGPDLGLWMWWLWLVFCQWNSPKTNCFLLTAALDASMLLTLLIILLSKGVYVWLCTRLLPWVLWFPFVLQSSSHPCHRGKGGIMQQARNENSLSSNWPQCPQCNLPSVWNDHHLYPLVGLGSEGGFTGILPYLYILEEKCLQGFQKDFLSLFLLTKNWLVI